MADIIRRLLLSEKFEYYSMVCLRQICCVCSGVNVLMASKIVSAWPHSQEGVADGLALVGTGDVCVVDLGSTAQLRLSIDRDD
jgi:hypothetical protein